jgi:alanine racemase
VHVKLDSGMGRLGTKDPGEARALSDRAASEPGLELAGVWTHFATADEEDPAFVRRQLAAFTPWIDAIRPTAPGVIVHSANSAAAIAHPATRYDLVRCGIAVYGLDPFQGDPAQNGLEPALALETYVAEVKRCDEGESCGYGRRYVASEPRWIATLPIGYGDGLRRAHTNNLDVLVAGRRVPLVGTVSMDNVTVDLGPAEDSAEPPGRGEAAVIIGSQDTERVLAEELAERIGTINYEITCGLSSRVTRSYHRDGAPVDGEVPLAHVPDRP